MKYNRPIQRNEGPKQFESGTYVAKIKKIINKPAKSGSNMFTLCLEGKNEQQGRFFLTFGNEYTQDNINFILASVEDNGVEIPDIEFGHNKETFEFLKNKDVFIKVEEGTYLGKPQHKISEFLTLEEFETSEETGGFEEFVSTENQESEYK